IGTEEHDFECRLSGWAVDGVGLSGENAGGQEKAEATAQGNEAAGVSVWRRHGLELLAAGARAGCCERLILCFKYYIFFIKFQNRGSNAVARLRRPGRSERPWVSGG